MLNIQALALGFVGSLWTSANWNIFRSVYLTNGSAVLKGAIYLLLTNLILQSTVLFDYTTEEELLSVKCTAADSLYRKADGTCNNPQLPKMGAKGTRLGRNVRSTWETETPPAEYLWEPSPEKAASLLTSLPGQRVEISSLNLFFAAWIQFQTHDWFAHENDDTAPPYQMKTRSGTSTFPLQPTKRDSDGYMRTKVTHWWDMSQVYGSDEGTRDRLRSFTDGKLELDSTGGFLPKNASTGQMETGFTENLWSGLETLHTLYVKEHNHICDELKSRNPSFDDEKLFETARMINAAQNAIIHTEEWTAILLQNYAPTMTLRIATRGITTMRKQFKDKLNIFDYVVLSALKTLGITGAEGMGSESVIKGGTFSQTEDFVSVYRMHALLPDNMTVNGETSSLLDHSFGAGRKKVEEHGMQSMIEGMAAMRTTALTLNNFPHALSHLTIRPGVVLDMAAVDIFRDRERGIPKLNDFRQSLGLTRYASFEEVNPDPAVAQQLRSVYDSVDDIDLQVGLMAENPRPAGFAISETTFFIFVAQTTRRLQADRFYQESLNEETYTAWGLEYVFSATFRRLLENNYPATLAAFPDPDKDSAG
eukprot:gene17029-26128_t